MGFFDNSLGDTQIGPSGLPHPSAKRSIPSEHALQALAAREWNELPYTMMRLTPARRRSDEKPLFWQDRTLQLGDIDLDLRKTAPNDSSPTYVATFRINKPRRAVTPHPSPKAPQTHREFTLYPSLQDDQLRWTSPGISDSLMLTSEQLAEKLLSKLVSFYTRGLS